MDTLTLIAVFALGVLAKCLWDFLSDALDRRHDRKYTATARNSDSSELDGRDAPRRSHRRPPRSSS
jgi:hypothetical protein